MFGLFKKTKPDIVEALINQTIGGQSVMYRLFREALGCEDFKIRRLELTYFASAVMTAVYLRLGKEPNREQILDRVTRNILEKSVPQCGEQISFGAAAREYQILLCRI